MTDSNKNMDLWNSVCVTDPKKVKKITGKDYQGSSPQPYWLVQRATEVFGPCGQNWGIEVKNQGFEHFDEFTIMHWALVAFWYIEDGKKCVTEHMGGTKAMYKTSNGSKKYDEDAPKKSVTDAVVKAMSYLGFAGDIFGGLWDDSKYIEYANEYHHSDNGQQQQNNKKNQNAAQQQKPKRSIDQLYQDGLDAIQRATDPNILKAVYNTLKGTAYEQNVINACKAKRDLEGWETISKKSQQQSQSLHH